MLVEKKDTSKIIKSWKLIINRETLRHEDLKEGGNQETKLNCTYKSRTNNPRKHGQRFHHPASLRIPDQGKAIPGHGLHEGRRTLLPSKKIL